MLSAGTLDRDAAARFDHGLRDRLLADPQTRVLDMRGARMPVVGEPAALAFRAPADGDDTVAWCYLGRQDGRAVIALLGEPLAEGGDAAQGPTALGRPAAETYRSLRSIASALTVADLGVAVTGAAMSNWHVMQRFCSRCGSATRIEEAGWVHACDRCGLRTFPRTDAAVIMSVVDDDDRLLLAQGTRFRLPSGLSVLAGFLEPGESLEATVRREVMEEVGIRVGEVSYVDNQPWPMPASLMVGFEARAISTDITIDPGEIRSARWFSREELRAAMASGEVTVPPQLSIARHLIERWYGAVPPQPGDPA
ncbi:NAD(+) diphosphatase [Calidifontibacter terrae]